MCKCKRCGRTLKKDSSIAHGLGETCYRIVQLQQLQKEEKQPVFDMNEIKIFITSEIQKTLKEFNFNKPITNTTSGILPIKPKSMPKFDPLEVNKRLVVKELKKQLEKGINSVLQKVGSFDNEINFLEAPVEVLT